MASYKTSEFEKALETKGYKRDNTHHQMFWYYLDGKKSSVHTRMSHNEREFDDGLFGQRRKQLGLTTKQQLIDFIECPLTADQYRQHLIDNDLVSRFEEP